MIWYFNFKILLSSCHRCETSHEYKTLHLKWRPTRAWFISSKVKIKDRHKLNVDESLCAPKTKNTSTEKKHWYLFPSLQLCIKAAAAAAGQRRLASSGQTVAEIITTPTKKTKSHQPNCPSRFARNIFRNWKTTTFALDEGDIHVHLLYLCKQAWKSGFAGTASPTGFNLQGPMQGAVIGCSRCCRVEPKAANSHVSSGPPPPPEHWARTAPGAPVTR